MTFFIISVILLNIMPGPAMLFVAHQTLNRGIRAGVLSIAGIELGTLLHITASIMGLTIAISKSTYMFTLIQYISAGFLIYLGISQILNTKASINTDIKSSLDKNYVTFFKGMIINLLNPK